MNQPKKDQGLTLVEILIAITIMSFISILIFGAINRSVRLKVSMDKSSEVAIVGPAISGMFQRDIAQIYSPHLLPKHFSRADTIIRQSQSTSGPSGRESPAGASPPEQPQPAAAPVTDPQQIFAFQPWGFKGEKESMAFFTTAGRRQSAEDKQAEFQQVAYYLADAPEGRKALMRATFPGTKEGRLTITQETEAVETLVYDRVLSLEFRYCHIRENEKKCEDKWDSTSRQGEPHPYPHIIDIDMTLFDTDRPNTPQPLSLSLGLMIDLNIPYGRDNNPFFIARSTASSPTGGRRGEPRP